MSVSTKLAWYIEELENTNAACQRPKSDGSPCVQCYERGHVILRLKEILEGK